MTLASDPLPTQPDRVCGGESKNLAKVAIDNALVCDITIGVRMISMLAASENFMILSGQLVGNAFMSEQEESGVASYVREKSSNLGYFYCAPLRDRGNVALRYADLQPHDALRQGRGASARLGPGWRLSGGSRPGCSKLCHTGARRSPQSHHSARRPDSRPGRPDGSSVGKPGEDSVLFSFAQTPVMFIGLILMFTWCTVWSLVELLRSTTANARIMHCLHLFMSVVMLLMVPRPTWQALSAVIPTPILAVMFVLCALWFVWDAWRGNHHEHPGHRRHLVAHAIMFAAMSWHLAGMAVAMASMKPGGHGDHGHGNHGGHGMEGHAGHGMPGHGMEPMTVIAWVGLPFMAALLIVGVAELIGCLRTGKDRAQRAHLASGAAMNLGMFWMSVGLIAALVPFLKAIQV